MAKKRNLPHPDTLDIALTHYNETFRHRYALPRLMQPYLERVSALDRLFDRAEEIRADGVADASCAILARIALADVPRYAIGLITADERVHVVGGSVQGHAAFTRGQVLLTNPLGGNDNWSQVAKLFHSKIGEDGRRRALAGLASEERRDYESIDPLLRSRGPMGPAVVIPPSEGFSARRAAEVAFIYDISTETLRAWRRKYRGERSSGKPGAPRKNR